MSTVSTRFALKEKRVGKNPKIALTRLTSTPSNPYGSRAETCQPQPVIFAACQGAGMIPPPPEDASSGKQGLVVDRFPGFPKRPYKRRRRIFIVFLSIKGNGVGAWPP